jgi:hypothetical protein
LGRCAQAAGSGRAKRFVDASQPRAPVSDALQSPNSSSSSNVTGHAAGTGNGAWLSIIAGSRRHRGDMPTGTFRAILRQLGLSNADLEH